MTTRAAILHTTGHEAQHELALELRRRAPRGHRAEVIGCTAYAVDVATSAQADAFVVLSPELASPLRRALDASGSKARMVVRFDRRWPQDLDLLSQVYVLSDGVVFDDGTYRLRSGYRAGTRTVCATDAPSTYFDLVSDALASAESLREAEAPRATLELSGTLTVFVTTVGAPSYPACLQRLHHQDCRFPLVPLEHIAPMSAAMQRMLDLCETRYFVQVDEDMLLHSHAIRALHERMLACGPDVALTVGPLFDCHLRRCIQGVKIFAHEIVSRYPLRNVESCEVDQITRLTADGFRLEVMPFPGEYTRADDVLGLHGTQWSPESIYERYFTQQRKMRRRPKSEAWFGAYHDDFLQRFLTNPDRLNFFALMGVVAGALSDIEGRGREKDYRSYASLRGLDSLRMLERELGGHEPRTGQPPDDDGH